MKPGVDWDDKLIARFKALHRGGKRSFKQIADMLSQEFGLKLTKNACIGKGRRLGLEQRPRSTPKPEPEPKKRASSTPELVPRPVVATAWRVDTPILTGCIRITIYQLRQGVCHFPFGDRPPYAYCGNTTARGMPWCPHHQTVVYPRGAPR